MRAKEKGKPAPTSFAPKLKSLKHTTLTVLIIPRFEWKIKYI